MLNNSMSYRRMLYFKKRNCKSFHTYLRILCIAIIFLSALIYAENRIGLYLKDFYAPKVEKIAVQQARTAVEGITDVNNTKMLQELCHKVEKGINAGMGSENNGYIKIPAAGLLGTGFYKDSQKGLIIKVAIYTDTHASIEPGLKTQRLSTVRHTMSIYVKHKVTFKILFREKTEEFVTVIPITQWGVATKGATALKEDWTIVQPLNR
ncbi:hypothetical protein DFR58_1078 [Anaerobacterium chartisolvens]|uniref:Sporulation protein YunB n=1 Tax=Anaerobacterium chartisolvens TaxID=1297424 RepID=A0A369B825_9FIRM|nr:hypothetical protein [Anaerobacterium chartisolvens]RCX17465.1 hypothetical protein DFR58_1078 [Anaerobacterium chartisolvens]